MSECTRWGQYERFLIVHTNMTEKQLYDNNKKLLQRELQRLLMQAVAVQSKAKHN